MAWVARSGDLVPQSWEGFFEPLFPLPPAYSLPESRIAGGANGGERQKEGKGRKRKGLRRGLGRKGGGTRGQLFPTGGGRSDIFLEGCVFP